MFQSKNRFSLIVVIALCVISLALAVEVTFEDEALADPPEAGLMNFMGNEDLSIMKFVEGDFDEMEIPQETSFEASLINPMTGNTVALVPGEFSLGGPQYVYVGEFEPGADLGDEGTLFYELDGTSSIDIDAVLLALSDEMFFIPPLSRLDILSSFTLADDVFGNALITRLPQGNYKVVEHDHPTITSYNILYLSDNEPSDGSIELDGTWGKSVDIFNTFILGGEPEKDPDLNPEDEEEPKSPTPPPSTSKPTPPPKSTAPPVPKPTPVPSKPAPKISQKNNQSAASRQTARAMPRTGDFSTLGFWGPLTALASLAAVPVLKSLKDKEGDSDD